MRSPQLRAPEYGIESSPNRNSVAKKASIKGIYFNNTNCENIIIFRTIKTHRQTRVLSKNGENPFFFVILHIYALSAAVDNQSSADRTKMRPEIPTHKTALT